MGKLKKIYKWIKDKGLLWTILYILRLFVCKYIVSSLEKYLIHIEKRKFLTGNGLISSYHTIEINRKIWNSYNWQRGGEEWTQDAKRYKNLDPNLWKNSLINKTMLKYIKKGTTILEIGPGAGRWTEVLLTISDRLLIVDISERALELCKEKFKDHSNIEYYLINDPKLDFIRDNSIDYIWSYDVFVHINLTDIERYISEFQRILKSNGCGIIHHAGTYLKKDEEWVRKMAFRSYMDGKFFMHLVEKYNMKIIKQDDSLVHMPGDLISVFVKP